MLYLFAGHLILRKFQQVLTPFIFSVFLLCLSFFLSFFPVTHAGALRSRREKVTSDEELGTSPLVSFQAKHVRIGNRTCTSQVFIDSTTENVEWREGKVSLTPGSYFCHRMGYSGTLQARIPPYF